MNELEQIELITLLMSLSPFEQKDVLRFVRVRHAQKSYYARPITAREWEQLTKWQKKKIMITLFIRVQAYRRDWIKEHLRQVRRAETSIIIFFRSFTPSGRAILREWREWQKNNQA